MRPARLALPALLICFAVLGATGCGAGQVSQTATQVITQEGANAERGGVAVRTVLIPPPLRGSYASGEPAPLYLAITTEEGVADTLVGVTTDAAASVVLVRSPFEVRPSPSATPTQAPSPSPGPEGVSLDIGNSELVLLTAGKNYLELRGLTRQLSPGDTVRVSFMFAKAGEITLGVPVATPDTPGPRLRSSEGAEHE